MTTIAKKFLQLLFFNNKKQQAFLEDLSSLLEDGVSLKEAINTMDAIASGKTKEVTQSIQASLAQGSNLAGGLQDWFPTAIVEIIRAGENSGTLSQSVSAAANALKNKTTVASGIINSITYPAVVVIIALIVLVIIKRTVLENFAAITPINRWPSNGASLYYFAYFIENWWWLVGLAFALITLGLYKLLTELTGENRASVDNIPLLSLYRDNIAARFMQTLGLLIHNGIILKKALMILSYEAKPYLAWHLMMMEYRLSGGMDNIADILETNLLRREDLLRLKVIGKGKGFAHALMSLGQQAAQRNQRLALLLGRLAGALLLLLGAAIAAKIILGIYAIGNSLAQ